jgi:hypothetical protein
MMAVVAPESYLLPLPRSTFHLRADQPFVLISQSRRPSLCIQRPRMAVAPPSASDVASATVTQRPGLRRFCPS